MYFKRVIVRTFKKLTRSHYCKLMRGNVTALINLSCRICNWGYTNKNLLYKVFVKIVMIVINQLYYKKKWL